MATQTRKMTASEFLALPESNLHHELIRGEEIMAPSPTGKHQRLLGRFYKLIDRLIPDGEVLVAPMDVQLDESNVPQPDIIWVAEHSACHWAGGDKYLQGPPDLVVEIFSPGTFRRDKKDKFRLYEKFGVREYWMVDPDEEILEIWTLRNGRFELIDVFGPADSCESPLLGTFDLTTVFMA
jgi:Uma2 family endonuclease